MKAAKAILASAALTILLPSAFAQQDQSGMITRINRLNGTMAIQVTQAGTVGANNGGSLKEFNVKDGHMLDNLHAGDRVTFSATGSGEMKTITQIKK